MASQGECARHTCRVTPTNTGTVVCSHARMMLLCTNSALCDWAVMPIYVHVVRAAHLPVNNVMLSFIIVHTLLPACSLGTLEPCIMELNVVARALVDVLV